MSICQKVEAPTFFPFELRFSDDTIKSNPIYTIQRNDN